ncbi:MAG: hypothetical protein LBT97_08385 [Planctomycetota bacterium]|nr:hypothetical protein [Planctomycetota bacterium]
MADDMNLNACPNQVGDARQGARIGFGERKIRTVNASLKPGEIVFPISIDEPAPHLALVARSIRRHESFRHRRGVKQAIVTNEGVIQINAEDHDPHFFKAERMRPATLFASSPK